MADRVRDQDFAAFLAEQHRGLYRTHIGPFNRMVNELRTDDEWMPHVSPSYAGTQARMLTLFQDPGPKTQDGAGSGMLCTENRDPSAERQHRLLDLAGIPVSDIIAWNAYPWYINSKPTSAQLSRGLPVLNRVIELCPNLQVVMLHGGVAQDAWRKYRNLYPATARRLHMIETFHTSNRALIGTEKERQGRLENLGRAYAEAASVLYRRN